MPSGRRIRRCCCHRSRYTNRDQDDSSAGHRRLFYSVKICERIFDALIGDLFSNAILYDLIHASLVFLRGVLTEFSTAYHALHVDQMLLFGFGFLHVFIYASVVLFLGMPCESTSARLAFETRNCFLFCPPALGVKVIIRGHALGNYPVGQLPRCDTLPEPLSASWSIRHELQVSADPSKSDGLKLYVCKDSVKFCNDL